MPGEAAGSPAIRDARPADRPALTGFMAALQDHERAMEPNRIPGTEMAETHLAALEAWAGETGGGVLVADSPARRAPQLAGFLVYGTREEMGCFVLPENRRVGELSDLWVEPAYRGQGVGQALIRAAEARLGADGIRRIEISLLPANAAARRFYARLGYGDALLTVARQL